MHQRKGEGGKFESQTFFRTRKKPRERKSRKVRESAVETQSNSTETTPVAGPSNAQDTTPPIDEQGPSDNHSPIECAGQGLEPVEHQDIVSEDSNNDDGEDDDNGFEEVDPTQSWFSDTTPVRVGLATPWKTKMETKTKITYSPMFTSITERLTDQATTGVLGSMTREPTMVDAASVLAIAKYTASSTTSVLEIAAMVRLGCLTMSI